MSASDHTGTWPFNRFSAGTRNTADGSFLSQYLKTISAEAKSTMPQEMQETQTVRCDSSVARTQGLDKAPKSDWETGCKEGSLHLGEHSESESESADNDAESASDNDAHSFPSALLSMPWNRGHECVKIL